ncbi:TIGR01906 family membrane protein [Lactobacillus sp. LC28-10]|uniref:TIGR01906 family membrane protein n=1 Tax=Secundilactobacillus angelensis TaxID=2722706 RepID=A0ABX1KYG7_9LACO|nr:TIGR01906 family membrane protein [Secundilactobacillus angelensis]NLR18195.1 TIGR01906 family membrane protein [Secundilactobacillus angelensis]
MNKDRVKVALQWFSLFLAIITLVIFLTINSVWLYWLNVKVGRLSHIVELSTSRIMENYLQLLAYLQLPWVTKLDMMDFPTSPSGLQHFIDVKHLFLVNNSVLIITIWPAVRFLRTLSVKKMLWKLIRPFQTAALVPVLAGLLMLVNFNQFFVDFHKILFRNSDWLFDPRFDPVILVLPETFFSQCFILAFGLFELIMLWGVWRGKRTFLDK